MDGKLSPSGLVLSSPFHPLMFFIIDIKIHGTINFIVSSYLQASTLLKVMVNLMSVRRYTTCFNMYVVIVSVMMCISKQRLTIIRISHFLKIHMSDISCLYIITIEILNLYKLSHTFCHLVEK